MTQPQRDTTPLLAPRRIPRTPHPVTAPRSPVPPDRIGAGHRTRWRRGTGRWLTRRRVVGLARFGVGTGLDPDLVQLESLVRTWASERGRRTAERAARRNDRRHRKCASSADRATALQERATHVLTGVVVDPVAGVVGYPTMTALHEDGMVHIAASAAAAERQHRRTGRGHRLVARVLPWLDALLFAYFIAGVSNADLTAPWRTPVESLVAVALTILVVLVCSAFTPWLGRRLRADKDVRGEVDWSSVGPFSVGLLGLWSVVVAALGVTMFVRISTEAAYAHTVGLTATVVAVMLSLAAVTLCVYVLGVSFADGTPETDDRDVRSRLVARHERRSRRLVERAAAALRRQRRLERAVESSTRRAAARATAWSVHGEELLALARLRTGVTAGPEPGRSNVI